MLYPKTLVERLKFAGAHRPCVFLSELCLCVCVCVCRYALERG